MGGYLQVCCSDEVFFSNTGQPSTDFSKGRMLLYTDCWTLDLQVIPVINLLLKLLLHGSKILSQSEDKYFIRQVRKRGIYTGIYIYMNINSNSKVTLRSFKKFPAAHGKGGNIPLRHLWVLVLFCKLKLLLLLLQGQLKKSWCGKAGEAGRYPAPASATGGVSCFPADVWLFRLLNPAPLSS